MSWKWPQSKLITRRSHRWRDKSRPKWAPWQYSAFYSESQVSHLHADDITKIKARGWLLDGCSLLSYIRCHLQFHVSGKATESICHLLVDLSQFSLLFGNKLVHHVGAVRIQSIFWAWLWSKRGYRERKPAPVFYTVPAKKMSGFSDVFTASNCNRLRAAGRLLTVSRMKSEQAVKWWAGTQWWVTEVITR